MGLWLCAEHNGTHQGDGCKQWYYRRVCHLQFRWPVVPLLEAASLPTRLPRVLRFRRSMPRLPVAADTVYRFAVVMERIATTRRWRSGTANPASARAFFRKCSQGSRLHADRTDRRRLSSPAFLAAVILPRFDGRQWFRERGFSDETVSALRYAQKAAIALRRLVCAVSPQTAEFQRWCCGSSASQLRGGVAQGTAGPLRTESTGGHDLHISGRPPASTVAGGVAAVIQCPGGLPAGLAITVEQETGYVRYGGAFNAASRSSS